MKEKTKITAIDDGSFNREKDEQTTLIATVTQGPLYIEKVKSTRVKVDGLNSTEKITQLTQKSNHVKQSNALIIHGSTVAGFNLIDIQKLHEDTEKPVITVLRNKPDEEEVRKALENTDKTEERKQIIEKNPGYKKHREIYYTATGIEEKEAEELLEKLQHKGNLPEPLRISHVIAKGVTEND